MLHGNPVGILGSAICKHVRRHAGKEPLAGSNQPVFGLTEEDLGDIVLRVVRRYPVVNDYWALGRNMRKRVFDKIPAIIDQIGKADLTALAIQGALWRYRNPTREEAWKRNIRCFFSIVIFNEDRGYTSLKAISSCARYAFNSDSKINPPEEIPPWIPGGLSVKNRTTADVNIFRLFGSGNSGENDLEYLHVCGTVGRALPVAPERIAKDKLSAIITQMTSYPNVQADVVSALVRAAGRVAKRISYPRIHRTHISFTQSATICVSQKDGGRVMDAKLSLEKFSQKTFVEVFGDTVPPRGAVDPLGHQLIHDKVYDLVVNLADGSWEFPDEAVVPFLYRDSPLNGPILSGDPAYGLDSFLGQIFWLVAYMEGQSWIDPTCTWSAPGKIPWRRRLLDFVKLPALVPWPVNLTFIEQTGYAIRPINTTDWWCQTVLQPFSRLLRAYQERDIRTHTGSTFYYALRNKVSKQFALSVDIKGASNTIPFFVAELLLHPLIEEINWVPMKNFLSFFATQRKVYLSPKVTNQVGEVEFIHRCGTFLGDALSFEVLHWISLVIDEALSMIGDGDISSPESWREFSPPDVSIVNGDDIARFTDSIKVAMNHRALCDGINWTLSIGKNFFSETGAVFCEEAAIRVGGAWKFLDLIKARFFAPFSDSAGRFKDPMDPALTKASIIGTRWGYTLEEGGDAKSIEDAYYEAFPHMKAHRYLVTLPRQLGGLGGPGALDVSGQLAKALRVIAVLPPAQQILFILSLTASRSEPHLLGNFPGVPLLDEERQHRIFGLSVTGLLLKAVEESGELLSYTQAVLELGIDAPNFRKRNQLLEEKGFLPLLVLIQRFQRAFAFGEILLNPTVTKDRRKIHIIDMTSRLLAFTTRVAMLHPALFNAASEEPLRAQDIRDLTDMLGRYVVKPQSMLLEALHHGPTLEFPVMRDPG